MSGKNPIAEQPDARSFEERIFARLDSIDARLTKLEEASERRAVETKPILEQALTEIPDLASLDDTIRIFGRTGFESAGYTNAWRFEKMPWRQIFLIIAPHLLILPSDVEIRSTLARILCLKYTNDCLSPSIDDEVYQAIKIQLQVLGFVKVEQREDEHGGMELFWSLTKLGHSQMILLGATRAKQNDKAT